MNKFEKAILFFALFTIILIIGRQIDLSESNLSIADSILLLVCYGIALYSTLGVAVYNIYLIIDDKIHKK